MADPHHVPEMDALDRATVVLYRTGIAISALSLGLLAAAPFLPGVPAAIPRGMVLAGTALIVADLHLYDKRIRWVIGASAWVGAGLAFAGATAPAAVAHWLAHAGLGFLFVSLSAIALKEQFCFRIPLLRAVPALLAVSLVPLVLGATQLATVFLAPAALVFAAMGVAKARMPLHYDIGNKAAYQV